MALELMSEMTGKNQHRVIMKRRGEQIIIVYYSYSDSKTILQNNPSEASSSVSRSDFFATLFKGL